MLNLLMRDFNERVMRRRRSEVERMLEPHGKDERNVKGERLICVRERTLRS